MSKAVLISIQPKWCEKIANDKKLVEVRKSKPKLSVPFKCYIYCTKDSKKPLAYSDYCGYDMTDFSKDFLANGQVIGEFVCDRIYQYASDLFRSTPMEGTDITTEEMARMSCLTAEELYKYEHSAEPRENCIYLVGVYGWHLSNLVIYEQPKDLSEFYKHGTLSATDWEYQIYDGSGDPSRSSYASYLFTRAIRKPPQSWCYVEALN